MEREITYSDAGVDRKLRKKSKEALRILKETYDLSSFGQILQLPYGNVFPIDESSITLCFAKKDRFDEMWLFAALSIFSSISHRAT